MKPGNANALKHGLTAQKRHGGLVVCKMHPAFRHIERRLRATRDNLEATIGEVRGKVTTRDHHLIAGILETLSREWLVAHRLRQIGPNVLIGEFLKLTAASAQAVRDRLNYINKLGIGGVSGDIDPFDIDDEDPLDAAARMARESGDGFDDDFEEEETSDE